MSIPHPLNHAVIAQVLHDMRNGQFRRCQTMGFTPDALAALKEPALISRLLNAKVSWCSVKVNADVVQRLLNQDFDVEREIETIDRILRLGGSTDMVGEFFGLTHQEVALRRQMLDLPPRKGRWPVLDEAQDAALWENWQARIKASGVDPLNDTAMLPVAMDLAEERALPLSIVWSAIRHWIDQGLM